MEHKGIKLLLLVILLGIIAVVITDHLRNRPGKRPGNKFAFDVSDYSKADPDLISHAETGQLRSGPDTARAIAWHQENIYLLYDGYVRLVTTEGRETARMPLPLTGDGTREPRRIRVMPDGGMLVAYQDHLILMNASGELLHQSERQEGALFASIAWDGHRVYVSDGGNRKVFVYNEKLEETGGFAGESGVSDVHGFILPSLHFDMAVDAGQELWVVNPGLHQLQLYAPDGNLRRHWGVSSFAEEGFSGCCNPYFIDFLSDGSFVTSEKGLVRVKVHHPSGRFTSYVAGPESFRSGKRAPALAITEKDQVLLLDFDKQLIRIFEPIMP